MWLVAEGADIGNETESALCECVNECEMISFSTALSSSQMSTKTVLSEIVHSSDVAERFIAATETRHRVQASLMMQTVSLLTDAVQAHYVLSDLINFHVIVPHTSITTSQSRLLMSLGDMMRGHIEDSISLLSILNDVYLKHVNYLVTGLSTQLQDCDSLTAEVHVIAIRAQTTLISATETERLELLRERLEYLRTGLVDFDSMLHQAARSSTHQWHYFPDRLLIGDCNTIFESVNQSLQYHTDWLDSFIPAVYFSSVPPVDAVVFANMTTLRSHMASLSKCLMSYKEELESFEEQMNLMHASTYNAGFHYDPPVTILSKFQSGGKWLREMADNYVANLFSKKGMAEMFANSGSVVISYANRLYADIDQSLFTKLGNTIDDQERIMVSFYIDLQQRVDSLQRYMFANDTKLEEFMRSCSIWRMPIVNLQSSEVLLLGRVALGAQRPIVIKLSRERSVGRSVCLSSALWKKRQIASGSRLAP